MTKQGKIREKSENLLNFLISTQYTHFQKHILLLSRVNEIPIFVRVFAHYFTLALFLVDIHQALLLIHSSTLQRLAFKTLRRVFSPISSTVSCKRNLQVLLLANLQLGTRLVEVTLPRNLNEWLKNNHQDPLVNKLRKCQRSKIVKCKFSSHSKIKENAWGSVRWQYPISVEPPRDK